MVEKWDKIADVEELPVLAMTLGEEGYHQDLAMGPQETETGQVGLGLLPVIDLVGQKEKYNTPTRNVVAKQMAEFMQDIAARNAVGGTTICEKAWEATQHPSLKPGRRYFRWPNLVESSTTNNEGKKYTLILTLHCLSSINYTVTL